MKPLAVIDVEYSLVVEHAMIGARKTDRPRREVRPFIIESSLTTPSSRDEYVEFLKDTALSLGKKAVLEILLPALPSELTTGILGTLLTPLIGFLVGKILEIAIRETEIGLFFLYIDLRTSAQGRDFEKMARANLEKQKNGTPQEIARAEKELVDAFRAFAKFTN